MTNGEKRDSTGAELAQASGGKPYNILFILTDQERYFPADEYPSGYTLPGRQRLQQRGVTFTNHQINTAVCTPSRSVIYTGQHIQHTKLFDNIGFPWSQNLNPNVSTLGRMLDEAGYYSAYKGKWHLSEELDTDDQYAVPQEKLTQAIKRHGFNDYVGIGDVMGMTLGGYFNDDNIGMQAQRWLRLRGQKMSQQGTPWFLSVNIVNPHDVMFYNTDTPEQTVQNDPKPLLDIAWEPNVPIYQQQWDVQLSKTRHQLLDAKGRPPAHKEYQQARAALVGIYPDEDSRWRRLLNYYFNCIQQTDHAVEGILDELEVLGLADNTIVVMTSDHGELAGAHGHAGKGTNAYREQNHVPLIVSHPGYSQTHGQQCGALTSHLDLAPTLVSWSGVDSKKQDSIIGHLRGKNLTPLLESGAKAAVNDLRQATLYCYNMFLYLDSEFMEKIRAYLTSGGDPDKLKEKGWKPDLTKRAAIRSVFDGRYKYNRYFSPREHHQPNSLDEIFARNDVELFDTKADPLEMNNLAMEPNHHGDLLLAMNEKLNQLIDAEVGVDDGSFMPGDRNNWSVARFNP